MSYELAIASARISEEDFSERRLVAASALAPYLFTAISYAGVFCEQQGITSPEERFRAARVSASLLIDDEAMMQAFAFDYAKHANDNIDPDFYLRILTLHGENLTHAALDDAHWVSKSAAEYLEGQDIKGQHLAQVLLRSKGLLFVGAADQKALSHLRDKLGDPITPDKFEMAGTGKKPKVDFTPEAKMQILVRKSERGGCPAHTLQSPDNSSFTLINDFWQRFIKYMYKPAP